MVSRGRMRGRNHNRKQERQLGLLTFHDYLNNLIPSGPAIVVIVSHRRVALGSTTLPVAWFQGGGGVGCLGAPTNLE
jgi:hypothetical protein